MGQKQSCSSSARHLARGVLYPIFGCLCMQLLSHQIPTREGTMVDRTAGGMKLWIYLRTYLRATFQRNGENRLRPRVPRWSSINKLLQPEVRLDNGDS